MRLRRLRASSRMGSSTRRHSDSDCFFVSLRIRKSSRSSYSSMTLSTTKVNGFCRSSECRQKSRAYRMVLQSPINVSRTKTSLAGSTCSSGTGHAWVLPRLMVASKSGPAFASLWPLIIFFNQSIF